MGARFPRTLSVSISIEVSLILERLVISFHLGEVQKQGKLALGQRVEDGPWWWWAGAGSALAGRGHEGVSWGSGNVPCLDLLGSYGVISTSNNLLGCTLKIYALYCMSAFFFFLRK